MVGKGPFPYRRTLDFLKAGRTLLRSDIKTVAVCLEKTNRDDSNGLRDYLLRDLPQLQYKNPEVQFLMKRNKDENQLAHIKFYLSGGKQLLLDTIDRTADEIKDLIHLAGSASTLEESKRMEDVSRQPNEFECPQYGHTRVNYPG